MKIKRTVKNIQHYRIGGFRYVTPSLFFYTRNSELEKRYTDIVAWILLSDGGKIPKHHIIEISFHHKTPRSVSEWGKAWTEKYDWKNQREKSKLAIYGDRKYVSLLERMRERVLSSINTRLHQKWIVVSVIGWTHGISKFRHSRLSDRSKTFKKKARRKHANHRR